jgi:hypothetical protein
MGDAPVTEEEDGLDEPLGDLRSVLIAGESIEAWAIQRRMFALTHRRVIVAATSGRLILITRPLLGGFHLVSVRWQDLEEVTLRVGVFGADLGILAGKTTDLASLGTQAARRVELKGLRKAQAQAVYRICQAQDQAWREKRRVRELEELRARSGGIQVMAGLPLSAGTAASGDDAVRRLQEAKRLLDARLITDAEYEAIKARIVAS